MMALPRQQVERALDFMLETAAIDHPERFVRHAVDELPRLVASELTTLSICDLVAGTRRVVSFPEHAISPSEQAVFNHLIHGHPLVQFHSHHAGSGSWRVSDSLTLPAFRRTPIFGEYYSRIGIDRVIAVPLITSPKLVMSFVLNRRGTDFSDRERDLLDRIRPALANLYRLVAARARDTALAPSAVREALSPRENEVLDWVAAGKTDLQIAQLLGLSRRTVQKHLENAYVKLGVENRTAAVMRCGSRRA
jgi:DNA-binding CsgD family transcriptional regulator